MERLIFPVTKKEAEKSERKYSSEKNKNALFPSQLRELRKEKGISQETLARDLGVSKSTIGLYETGDTLPDAKTLHDLAVYFGVSSDWLLGLSLARSTNAELRKICEYTGLSEQSVALFSSWNKAPLNETGMFISMVNTIFTSNAFQMMMYHLNDFYTSVIAKHIYWDLWERFFPDDIDINKLEGEKLATEFSVVLQELLKSNIFPSNIANKILAEHQLWESENETQLHNTLIGADGFSFCDLYEYRTSKDLLDLIEELRGQAIKAAEYQRNIQRSDKRTDPTGKTNDKKIWSEDK